MSVVRMKSSPMGLATETQEMAVNSDTRFAACLIFADRSPCRSCSSACLSACSICVRSVTSWLTLRRRTQSPLSPIAH
jgi:hypothetical protein